MIKTKQKNQKNPRYHAIDFLKNLDPIQRDRLKSMLINGVECCRGLANTYDISSEELQAELKDLLQVGGN